MALLASFACDLLLVRGWILVWTSYAKLLSELGWVCCSAGVSEHLLEDVGEGLLDTSGSTQQLAQQKKQPKDASERWSTHSSADHLFPHIKDAPLNVWLVSKCSKNMKMQIVCEPSEPINPRGEAQRRSDSTHALAGSSCACTSGSHALLARREVVSFNQEAIEEAASADAVVDAEEVGDVEVSTAGVMPQSWDATPRGGARASEAVEDPLGALDEDEVIVDDASELTNGADDEAESSAQLLL